MTGKTRHTGQPRRALVTGAHREMVAEYLTDFATTFDANAVERPDVVAMSYEDWRDLIDEGEAIAAYHLTRGEETFPEELIDRLLSGEPKMRVWREYRGLSLQALAEATGTTKGYLSEIESGKRRGSIDVLRRIADALKVDLHDLVT